MPATFRIKKYQLHYFGGEDYGDHHFGWIDLKDENDFDFGRINFYEKGHIREHSTHNLFVDGRTRYFLGMNADRLSDVLDMLRNESPVSFFYGTSRWAKIFTGDEDAGERDKEDEGPDRIILRPS